MTKTLALFLCAATVAVGVYGAVIKQDIYGVPLLAIGAVMFLLIACTKDK